MEGTLFVRDSKHHLHTDIFRLESSKIKDNLTLQLAVSRQ